MSSKSVPIPQPVSLSRPADAWIEGAPARSPKIEGPTKRLTVDIPKDLHKRIKAHCAEHETQISDAVRIILAEKFPAL